MIQQVLKFHLESKEYNTEEALSWSQAISDDVKAKIKGEAKPHIHPAAHHLIVVKGERSGAVPDLSACLNA